MKEKKIRKGTGRICTVCGKEIHKVFLVDNGQETCVWANYLTCSQSCERIRLRENEDSFFISDWEDQFSIIT